MVRSTVRTSNRSVYQRSVFMRKRSHFEKEPQNMINIENIGEHSTLARINLIASFKCQLIIRKVIVQLIFLKNSV